jgi:hypothetical protein
MTIEGEYALEAEHRQPQRLRRTAQRQRTLSAIQAEITARTNPEPEPEPEPER